MHKMKCNQPQGQLIKDLEKDNTEEQLVTGGYCDDQKLNATSRTKNQKKLNFKHPKNWKKDDSSCQQQPIILSYF